VSDHDSNECEDKAKEPQVVKRSRLYRNDSPSIMQRNKRYKSVVLGRLSYDDEDDEEENISYNGDDYGGLSGMGIGSL
jgi:hypothetical protein